MIDVHAHILPGIDDGADCIETSVEMARIAKNDGINKIVATAHYAAGSFETNLNGVIEKTNELNKVLFEKKIDVEILPGQEVFLDNNILKFLRSGEIGTLANTRYMLVELPMDYMPEYALDMVYELNLLGIKTVIAHPERYRYIIRQPSNINQFIDEGCFFQINSSSLTGLFGKEVKKTAEKLVKNNICSLLGSDAHTTNHRSPKLKEAFDNIHRINRECEENLKNNAELLTLNKDINQTAERIKEIKSFFDFIHK